LKVRSDKVQDGPSLREPSRDIALRFYPSSEQQGPIHLPLLDLPAKRRLFSNAFG
jgi:hypothetical protein